MDQSVMRHKGFQIERPGQEYAGAKLLSTNVICPFKKVAEKSLHTNHSPRRADWHGMPQCRRRDHTSPLPKRSTVTLPVVLIFKQRLVLFSRL
jgi:hypothetical protein